MVVIELIQTQSITLLVIVTRINIILIIMYVYYFNS